MARGGGHDHVLQPEHLGLLPGGPPPVAGGLLAPADAEDHGELTDRRAPGVPFNRGTVMERLLLRLAVLVVLVEVAVAAKEAAAPRATAERGGGGAARRAERGAGVAGGHRVGAVDVAVARQAEPGGVGPAVDRRWQAGAEVARGQRRRHLRVGGVRARHGFFSRHGAGNARRVRDEIASAQCEQKRQDGSGEEVRAFLTVLRRGTQV
uniref:Uncharacterized protein n=1 Tax=Arundo donax TaxID=35708 RepID=A0A0A9CY92_ARUDO